MINTRPGRIGSDSLSLVIVTCHSYNDVLEQLFLKLVDISFFEHYFDKIIIATDHASSENKFSSYGVTDVIEGQGWGERVKNALTVVRTKFCIVLLDDYIPIEPVRPERFNSVLSLINDNVDCIYLSSVFRQLPQVKKSDNDGFVLLPRSTLFKVNTTAGIWNVESLNALLKNDDSPWAWEAFAGFYTMTNEMNFYAPRTSSAEVYAYSHETGGAVYRGSWSGDALIKAGIDCEQLKKSSDRPVEYELKNKKRSLTWKIKFLFIGYKMVGFKVLLFIIYSIKSKYRKI